MILRRRKDEDTGRREFLESKKRSPKQPILEKIRMERGPGGYQKWLIEEFKASGARVLNIHGHAMQEAGWPDTYCSHPYFHGFIETKVNQPVSAKQMSVLNDLRSLGDHALVLRWDTESKCHLVSCIVLKEVRHLGRIFKESRGVQFLRDLQELALSSPH